MHGFRLGLTELWQYRYLVLFLTNRSFKVSYQQTLLGPLWIIINPILSALVYMFIFGHIAALGTDGIPQILFYFVSTSLWELFSFSLNTNSNTFVANAYLFSKVYFPRLAVPVSDMLVSVLKFCIKLIVIAVMMAFFLAKGEISPNWMLFPVLPFLFLQMSLLGMSIGILISSVTVKYRDILNVVTVGVSLLMYASPVVYPLASISDGLLKTIIMINPVSEIMELIRLIMLGRGEFDFKCYLAGLCVTVMLFILSSLVFNRVERTFADRV